MKNIITCGLILGCALVGHAQSHSLQIEWGEAFKSKRSMITDIVSTQDGAIYAVKERFGMFNSGVYIEKYAGMQPVQSTELEYESSRDEEQVKEVIRLGDELWVMNLNSSFEYAKLSAQQVDMRDLSIAENDEDIFHVDIERKMRYTYGGYLLATDKAHTHLGVIVQYPGSREEDCELEFQMRDAYMDMLWTDKVDLPYMKEMVELHAMEVDRKGTIYLLVRIYEPRSEGSSKRSKEFHYALFSMGATSGLKEISLDLDDRFLQQVDLRLNGKDLVIGGYSGLNCCTVEGVFHAVVDTRTMELRHFKNHSFSIDFMAQGYGKRVQRKMERRKEDGRDYGLDNIEFKEFITTEDGGLLIVGEMYDVAIHASDQKTLHDESASHFSYKDIVVARLDGDGELLWTRKILKRQETGEDAGLMSGYVMARMNGKTFFLFNDHKENLNVETVEQLQPFTRKKKEAAVALVTIAEDGSMSKEHLFDQKELEMEIRPHSCEQISENELILFGMSKSKNQFARVTFTEEELNVSVP